MAPEALQLSGAGSVEQPSHKSSLHCALDSKTPSQVDCRDVPKRVVRAPSPTELVNPSGLLLHPPAEERRCCKAPGSSSECFSPRSQVCLHFWKQLVESFAFHLYFQRACAFVIAGSICHLFLKRLSRQEVDKFWWHYG